ncbi:MAG: DUF4347 domain-containing protein, partial [Pseudohongiellaceae bacterium]
MKLPRKPGKRKGKLQSLEPRLLFDAAALVSLDSATDNTTDTQTAADTPDADAVQDDLDLQDKIDNLAFAVLDSPDAQDVKEIIFVDPSIADPEFFLENLQTENSITVLLDGDSDGVEQITQYLRQFEDIQGVHLITHGTSGALELGNGYLTSENLDIYQDMMAGWSDSLSESADILLYGCDIAFDTEGRAFVDQLAAFTGADVAASTDLTGSAALGGDWDLEYSTGLIELESIAILEFDYEEYQHLLNIDLSGSTVDWTPVLQGSTFDASDDDGGNNKGQDLVGDANHAMMYSSYFTASSTANDELGFRVRIDGGFSDILVVGIDADPDDGSTRMDYFLGLAAEKSGKDIIYSVNFYDPGTGTNTNPANTVLGTAIKASTGSFSVVNVGAGTDDTSPLNTNLDGDAETDKFVSFKVKFNELQTAMSNAGLSIDNTTQLQYAVMTTDKTGQIRGDVGGVNAIDATAYSSFASKAVSATGNYEPTITSTVTVSVAENQNSVTSVLATDANAGDDLTFSISAGADSGAFSIVATTGELVFNSGSEPDFEAQSAYQVAVTVDDGRGGTDTQSFNVNITNVNEAPVITSD